jgi:translation elongation factor EF-4
LTLNDRSGKIEPGLVHLLCVQSNFVFCDLDTVTVQRESSAALGQGCRLGFLGTLHMSVLVQRLKDEYGAEVCVTAPTVPYKGERTQTHANMLKNYKAQH